MTVSDKKLDVHFYTSRGGGEPVRKWLLTLTRDERKLIGDDILKIQHSWPIGKPLVDGLGNGLWEVRSNLGDRIARVIFYIEGREMILLHGFIKRTAKTPKQDLQLSLKRKKQLL